ncbi:MAG: hypothetical protein ACI9QL_004294, partial [Candidatus Omnitrophota bacterium]
WRVIREFIGADTGSLGGPPGILRELIRAALTMLPHVFLGAG